MEQVRALGCVARGEGEMPIEVIAVAIAGIFIGLAIGWLVDAPFTRNILESLDCWIAKCLREQKRADDLMQWIRRRESLGR